MHTTNSFGRTLWNLLSVLACLQDIYLCRPRRLASRTLANSTQAIPRPKQVTVTVWVTASQSQNSNTDKCEVWPQTQNAAAEKRERRKTSLHFLHTQSHCVLVTHFCFPFHNARQVPSKYAGIDTSNFSMLWICAKVLNVQVQAPVCLFERLFPLPSSFFIFVVIQLFWLFWGNVLASSKKPRQTTHTNGKDRKLMNCTGCPNPSSGDPTFRPRFRKQRDQEIDPAKIFNTCQLRRPSTTTSLVSDQGVKAKWTKTHRPEAWRGQKWD